MAFQIIDDLINAINPSLEFHIEICKELNIENNATVLKDCSKLIINISSKLKDDKDIKQNYINQINRNIQNVYELLPFTENMNHYIKDKSQQPIFRDKLIEVLKPLKIQFENLKFNFDFFCKVNFFSNNIVAVGANGSGKTSLAILLKEYLTNNGVVISAQRVLKIPQINNVSNINTSKKELSKNQSQDKTYKSESSYGYLNNEFQILLQNLFSDHTSVSNSYLKNSQKEVQNDQKISPPTISNLQKAFNIWNLLIDHRIIDTLDGVDIRVKSDNNEYYQAIQLSDGEKVILYLIAQVLLAPSDGFIIIDEPEMFLHKNILIKLWNILEKERQDSIFIYLTHDLDFAVSRISAKKVWIKSYNPPKNWEIVGIPENEIPECLMLQLLGSRKNILFCEGEKGSVDEQIYNLLFPNFTIIPVESCISVINFTKSFNKLKNTHSSAIGIIDSDFIDCERIESLKKDNVYTFQLSECENLFLDEEFLNLLNSQLLNVGKIDKIKENILADFEKDKEIQISNYISSKINYYFRSVHVQKGNKLEEVKVKYSEFQNEVKIDEWYNSRKELIEKIINDKDYSKAISVYNNKGLKKIPNSIFKINDFLNRSLNFLNLNEDAKKSLIKYFPEELIIRHNDTLNR